ncbi:Hypothetical predicted protein [Octopus vulgaris]|uniref:Uncharacterized protein n=1 Tax=Octopus vulgaris TaxID=6645 RepID=A0AA36FAV6_OCTVU|nr:Hypothetical predicted protein [Octopus vulgaris]
MDKSPINAKTSSEPGTSEWKDITSGKGSAVLNSIPTGEEFIQGRKASNFAAAAGVSKTTIDCGSNKLGRYKDIDYTTVVTTNKSLLQQLKDVPNADNSTKTLEGKNFTPNIAIYNIDRANYNRRENLSEDQISKRLLELDEKWEEDCSDSFYCSEDDGESDSVLDSLGSVSSDGEGTQKQ